MSPAKLKAINLLSLITEELSDEQFDDLKDVIEELDDVIRNI